MVDIFQREISTSEDLTLPSCTVPIRTLWSNEHTDDKSGKVRRALYPCLWVAVQEMRSGHSLPKNNRTFLLCDSPFLQQIPTDRTFQRS